MNKAFYFNGQLLVGMHIDELPAVHSVVIRSKGEIFRVVRHEHDYSIGEIRVILIEDKELGTIHE